MLLIRMALGAAPTSGPLPELAHFYWGWLIFVAQYALALLTRRRWLLIANFGVAIAMYFVYFLI